MIAMTCRIHTGADGADHWLDSPHFDGQGTIDVHALGSPVVPHPESVAVLVELDHRMLAALAGDPWAAEAENILGFTRYANGTDAPSRLVELVRARATGDSAVAAARALFEAAGYQVVVCTDQPGRIVDRLIRPVYNAALRLVDEGLATQADLDLTCRLGLGYVDGPVERVERGGLAHHYDVTAALFETFGTPGFAPAARSVAAAQRRAART